MTKIEWTDETWNPIIGCYKISSGCDHCYAERMANRISHMDTWAGEQYREVIGADGQWNGRTHLADSWMDKPKKWKESKMIFVGSMTDLFYHSRTLEGTKDVLRLFETMALYPQHTFQILTKRPTEMRNFINYLKYEHVFNTWPLPNVWLGVTVCNQEEADFRIPLLLETAAIKRFVSCEPLLGPIKLPDKKEIDIDWLIVGGETGPGARELSAFWLANLWNQAKEHYIPFFFKSAGSNGNSIRDVRWRVGWIETYKQFPK
jgi:protein gp37